MKPTFLLSISITVSLNVYAQSEPEHIADFTNGQFYYFNLIADNTTKIVAHFTGYFDLYNLDYTLYNSVTYPSAISSINSINANTYMISLSTFDCDSTNLEYMANVDTGNPLTQGVYVFREDGTQLLHVPNYRMNLIGNVINDPVQSPVWSDSTGTYAIVGAYPGAMGRKLYRFCGQIPNVCCTAGSGTVLGGLPGGIIKQEINLYPNPASGTITIDYYLQGHRHARAKVFSSTGALVRDLRLGSGFSSFQPDVSGLSTGTYIVTFVTDDGVQLSKKFVKIAG